MNPLHERTGRRPLTSLAALVLAGSLALAGCSHSEEPEATVANSSEPAAASSESPSSESAPKEKTCADKVTGAYQKVLANPELYSKDSQHPSVLPPEQQGYQYAMADTNRDSCPEMLLSKRFWEFSAVVVVSADEAGEPHATSSYVVDGTASGGGWRCWVLGSAAGDGLYEFEGQSMSTDWTLKHYRAAGDKIQLVGTRPVPRQNQPEAVMLDWSSTTAPSLMLAAVQGAPIPSSPDESTVVADTPVEAPRPLGPNEVRITGTVRFVTAYDLVNEPLSSLNGRYPNPSYDKPDDPYVILVLDQPMTLEGGRPGFSELESRNVKFVSLAAKGQDRNTWIPFDGQHVELIYDKQASSWPGDTGLPLGILRASVTEVNVK